MIYRVHVAVLCALPFTTWDERSQGEKDQSDFEAVACSFMVNATDAAEAIAVTTKAASHAVDRGGQYIGGIIIEADCRIVPPAELKEYEKHFHAPAEKPGIFYVSGTGSYTLPAQQLIHLLPELEKFRASLREQGPPSPSFVHPELPEDPPVKMRLICDKCKSWIEVDNVGLMYTFMRGSIAEFDERFGPPLDVAGPFMRRHLEHGGMTAFNEDDPRWNEPMEGQQEFPGRA